VDRRHPIGRHPGLPDPGPGAVVGPAGPAGHIGQRGRVAAAAEPEHGVGRLVQRQGVIRVGLEVAVVVPLVGPRDLRGVVSRDDVGADLAQLLGDRDAQLVGPLGDADDDVVAGLDPGAPVDQDVGVLADPVVHAGGFAGLRHIRVVPNASPAVRSRRPSRVIGRYGDESVPVTRPAVTAFRPERRRRKDQDRPGPPSPGKHHSWTTRQGPGSRTGNR